MFGFDVLHRYATGEQLSASKRTSFTEIVQALNVDVGACLHEHWYDDWVFLSMSTDEYFAFVHSDPAMLPKYPVVPTPLVQEYLERYVEMSTKPGRMDWMPLDPLGRRWRCEQAACFPVRWYGAKPDLSNTARLQTPSYENPALDESKRTHKRVTMTQLNESDIMASRLSFEERSYRTRKDDIAAGAARKCAYHPDWRTVGTSTKIHGFHVDGCPDNGWLSKSRTCSLAARPQLRAVCWELCGYWGKENRTDRILPQPVGWMKSRANNTCKPTHFDRHETQMSISYKGTGRLIPACPKDNTASCVSPLLERAHMRGDNSDVVEAPWLSRLAPVVKSRLAEVLLAARTHANTAHAAGYKGADDRGGVRL